jgi:hypothetical protein
VKRKKQDIRRRLLDVLKEDLVLVPLPDHDVSINLDAVISHNLAMRPFLERAQCVEASNIARFFEQSYVESPIKFDSFWTDLKSLVPPFEHFFIEWEKPYGIPTGLRMGVLFLACSPDIAEGVVRTLMGPNADATPKKISTYRELSPKWIFITLDFMEFSNTEHRNISGLRGPYHIGVAAVSEEGSLLDWWFSHGTSAISKEESIELAISSLVAWTALAMMNCSNIDTIAHIAPEPFQRARARRGKLPLVSYRTIQVNMEKTPRTIAAERLPEVDEEGRVRLHQKRGHMKDYRKGKGLFGKYKGLWYWGPSLAGSSEAGVVVSDYKVVKS